MWTIALLVLSASLNIVWGAERCCQYTGCFNNNYPFNHLPLPQCPESFNPVLRMYTRSNRNNGQLVTRLSIPSVFSRSRQTMVLIHGYQEDGYTDWKLDMKDALLDRGDYNVIAVDWNQGAGSLFYPQAAANVRTVGAHVGLVVQNLISTGGLPRANTYCIGFSLGGHTCGFVGKRVKMGRITGMDPAGPLFESYDNSAGLQSSDGDLVDVIHTHGAGGPTLNFGTLKRLGHIDFYPNSGGMQPGCITYRKKRQVLDPSCSHGRAPRYMLESITNNCFLSRQSCTDNYNTPGSCSSCGGVCQSMGFSANQYSGRGIYYLQTNRRSPYCQN